MDLDDLEKKEKELAEELKRVQVTAIKKRSSDNLGEVLDEPPAQPPQLRFSDNKSSSSSSIDAP